MHYEVFNLSSNIQNINCPACDEGSLIPSLASKTYKYKDNSFKLDNIEISNCDNCGVELMTPEQYKVNSKSVLEHKRTLDGLLSSSDIKRIRKSKGLTQMSASVVFGGGVNSFSKYERSEVMQSFAMDKLLRLTDMDSNSYKLLLSISGAKVHSVVITDEYVGRIKDGIGGVAVRKMRSDITILQSCTEYSNSHWRAELKDCA